MKWETRNLDVDNELNDCQLKGLKNIRNQATRRPGKIARRVVGRSGKHFDAFADRTFGQAP